MYELPFVNGGQLVLIKKLFNTNVRKLFSNLNYNLQFSQSYLHITIGKLLCIV